MARYELKTEDGIVFVDTDTDWVGLGSEGGPFAGASAQVDEAGNMTGIGIALGPIALGRMRKKDIYLSVQGERFAFVAKLRSSQQDAARRFAAAVNSAGRGGTFRP